MSSGTAATHADTANTTKELTEFDRWYALYPHKVGKGQARRAFTAARKKASLEVLIAGLEHYIRTKPARIEWCYPATWLNGERWLDQPAGTYVARPNGYVNGVWIEADTPQWKAWQAIKKTPKDRNNGWRFPSEWPTNYEVRDADQQEATEAQAHSHS